MLRTTRVVLCVTSVLVVSSVAAAQRTELAKARALYNERQFDAAIAAAAAARNAADTASGAGIVEARARLERYRERADPADLSAARSALASVTASALNERDRVEFLLALGESMFLEDDFGAAAEIFEVGLDSAGVDLLLRDALLEWWASAIERQASTLDRDLRRAAFERLASRMADELSKSSGSATASYWSVVALRGSGHTLRAWDAAVAGWARARLMGDRTAAFRADINQLVVDGLIPDRVRPLPPAERAQAEADLKANWELVKEKWK